MPLVRNLATLETRTYTCLPRAAVIAAHAQDHGDFNTWDYAAKYGGLVTEGRATYACGDWAVFKSDRE